MSRALRYLAVSTIGLAWGCADTPTVAPRAPARDPLAPTVQPSFAIGGGGPTGAIFTTVPDGSIVNENVRYRDKREVYLDGGPRGGSPQTAAGLDDGDYVFQITDPSGKYLLSQDKSECRLIRVRNGVIVKLLDRASDGTLTEHSASDACHTNDGPEGAAGSSGKHDTNVDVDYGANGAIVVQMMPYANTPNPGGVYKAWISKIDEYAAKATGKGVSDPFTEPLKRINGRDAQPCSQGCYQADPGFGPPRNFQKTDNFKVQEEARLRVVKVNDLDGDGVRDSGEPTLPDWGVAFIETLGDGTEAPPILDVTPATRTFVPGDQVTVCEASLTDWVFSFATVNGTAAGAPTTRSIGGTTYYCIPVTVGASGTTVEIAFGNFQYGVKSGYKFHDRNINGVWNTATEEGLAGWTINLTGADGKGNAVSRTTTTGAGGAYTFTQLPPGTYTVAEACPTGWYQSYPTPSGAPPGVCGTGVHTFTIVSGAPGAPDVHANNNFGNYQPSTKTGVKYHDLNGNGTRDAGEPGIAGVTIKLLSGGSPVQSAVTDANGAYTLSNILPGTYLVCEVLPDGYAQSAPNAGTTLGTGESLADCPAATPAYGAKGYQIVVSASAQSFTGNDFGNFQNGSIAGVKISDANGNGTQDGGEVGLAAWPIHLFGTTGLGAAVHRHTTTNGSGQFTFANVPPGQYRLCEEQKAGFVQRFPTLATTGAIDCGALLASVHDPVLPGIGYSLTLQSGQNLNAGLDFLNQPNQGCTPGFWQGGFGIDLWNTVNDPQWGPPRITNGSTNPFIQTTLFNSFFEPAPELVGETMLGIVGTGGTDDEARKAARSLIAGYLNTTALSAYPFSQSELVSKWSAANSEVDAGQRLARLLALHTLLDAANNLHNTVLCQ
ncbi:SdrD B-like domain-containing protein [Roseisolibacter agri]|uniref:SD-repeat containing protein B domain-containing protein n=1 Tax=Roseisolibacter agri TaxID=2014610 RepID=A0AA37V0B0_9BACT|nr:SdrD B-like domain-containing protein [Roseisolibacter agri]GLC24100.1 hypothetical protein rosag_06130 [Roseisolibacter agri]